MKEYQILIDKTTNLNYDETEYLLLHLFKFLSIPYKIESFRKTIIII